MSEANKVNKKKIDNLFHLIVIIIVSIFIVTIPILARSINNGSVILSYASYEEFNNIKDSYSSIFLTKLTQGNLKEFFLSFFNIDFVNYYKSSILISVIFLIISVICLYYIFDRNKISILKRYIYFMVLFLSFPFLYNFARLDEFVFILFIGVTSAYFYGLKSRYRLISYGIISIIFLSNIFNVLLMLILILFLSSHHSKKDYKIYIWPYVFLAFINMLYINKAIISAVTLNTSFFEIFFVELGGVGFGFFSLILTLYGIFLSLNKKKKYYVVYSSLIFTLLVYTLFIPFYINYIFIISSFFIWIAIINLYERKWVVEDLKQLSFFLLFSGFLFAFILTNMFIVNQEPNIDLVEKLSTLENLPPGNVLTHEKYGPLIKIYGHKPYVDSTSVDYNETYQIAQRLFYSRNLIKTKLILNNVTIDYIVITEEMKEGLIWNQEEEGILFLFRDDDLFKLLYKVDQFEVWEVLI